MTSLMKDTARLYRFNTRALHARIADLTPEEWERQIAASSSTFWILGHLCAYRRRVLRMLGEDLAAAAWEPAFERGTRPAEHPMDITAEDLVEDFKQIGDRIAERLEGLTPEEAEGPAGFRTPDGSDTIGTVSAFLLWHETYHVGQLGLIRKVLGKKAM